MDYKDIENRFGPYDGDPAPVVRSTARSLAFTINDFCPEGREKSLAITKLEEAVMWANAAMGRDGKNGGRS